MSDNTPLNVGTGGDTVRDLDREGAGVKTQVVALDLGGGAANAEVLIQAGQQEAASAVPVVLPKTQDTADLLLRLLEVHMEQLRCLKKMSLLLAHMTNQALDDDDVSPLIPE